ncbi:MAG: nucleoside triphosphate pyrophosphohydrolase [Marinilabiliales bacterium]|nr:MAG: nucleoside triphosphate pyrophosphohydrolase [Marinilabiliales bacterium]
MENPNHNNMDERLKEFERLLDIMDELREKCPWDRVQTLESLRNLTIEEAYELSEAISRNDLEDVKKELGDLLLHIVFYSKIGSELKAFDIDDVLKSINDKLIYRHPHVFGDTEVADENEVKENWEHLKIRESNKTVLSGVPATLPALIKANRIQDKVKGVGFDWEEKHQIWDKVMEELGELREEINRADKNKTEAEFGDLFFSLVNAARLYGIDPETALEKTNQKFTRRFNYLESQTMAKGKSLKEMTLDEMNVIWEEAKLK